MSRRATDRDLSKQARRSSRAYSLWRANMAAQQSNRAKPAGKISGQRAKGKQ